MVDTGIIGYTLGSFCQIPGEAWLEHARGLTEASQAGHCGGGHPGGKFTHAAPRV